MKLTLRGMLCLMLTWPLGALANSGIEATYDTRPDALWAMIDFHQPSENIMPPVATSKRSGEGVGATKINTLANEGGQIHLQLVHYDPDAYTFTYVIRTGPLPVKNYVGIVRVTTNAQGQAQLSWQGIYEPDGVDSEKADEILGGFYASIAEKIAETFPRVE
jgi:mxaD protein